MVDVVLYKKGIAHFFFEKGLIVGEACHMFCQNIIGGFKISIRFIIAVIADAA